MPNRQNNSTASVGTGRRENMPGEKKHYLMGRKPQPENFISLWITCLEKARSERERTKIPFLTANRAQEANYGAQEVQAIHQIQCFLAWPGFPVPLPFHGAQIP